MHKAQIALRVETGANMFRRFAIDIEFDKRQLIALPAIFAGRGVPVTPRAEGGEKMDFIARIFTPDAHRSLIVRISAGGKRR